MKIEILKLKLKRLIKEFRKGGMEPSTAEEEHEVYGGEIPDVDPQNGDVVMSGVDDYAVKVLDEMKKRLKEMEEEAAALREMQSKVEKEMGGTPDPAISAASQPKGFAYVEFLEVEAVQEALQLNESELHGRQLKVMAKRTNVPGMMQFGDSREALSAINLAVWRSEAMLSAIKD
ncbi:hypothetical protein QQ045_026952 [Rhodiola kirilowii]